MAYETFRVEVTRDETRDDGPVNIEITAHIDGMPETNEATVGRLNRASHGVWNSRLHVSAIFEPRLLSLAAQCEATRFWRRQSKRTVRRSDRSSAHRQNHYCDQPRPFRKNFPGKAPVGSPSSNVISPLTRIQSYPFDFWIRRHSPPGRSSATSEGKISNFARS